MAAAGLPAALHVNARHATWTTARWGDLIVERPEIEILAFEFATGLRPRRTIRLAHSSTLRARRSCRPPAYPRYPRRRSQAWRAPVPHFAHVYAGRKLKRSRAPYGVGGPISPKTGRLRWARFPHPKGRHRSMISSRTTSRWYAPHTRHRQSRPFAYGPPTRRGRRTADRNGEPIQPGLLRQLNLPGEDLGASTPEPQSIIAAAKP